MKQELNEAIAQFASDCPAVDVIDVSDDDVHLCPGDTKLKNEFSRTLKLEYPNPTVSDFGVKHETEGRGLKQEGLASAVAVGFLPEPVAEVVCTDACPGVSAEDVSVQGVNVKRLTLMAFQLALW